MNDVMGGSVDTLSAPESNSGSETSSPSEKMLRQSEVNEIVGKAKQDAASRAVEQYKRSQESQQSSYQEPRSQPSQGMSEERYRQVAAEEAQRIRDQERSEWQTKSETENAQRIVKNFYDKIAAGKEKYEDFEKVTGDVELQRFPNTVHMLAEMVDNPHDVLYELSKNRAKLAQIELTAREFPQEAVHDLKRLADSIKNNESVSNRKIPNAPLSQQRPTNVGTDAGRNALSMRDLKAKYRA
jgi:hypothetical protein